MGVCTKSIVFQVAALLLPPILLAVMAVTAYPYAAAASIAVILLALLPFFIGFEQKKPRPRDLVPIAVMSVIASLGRALFAAVPNFKPTTAIVMITGMQFGPQAGFLTGALSALASNMFLGQGPWTPWQMYAWGLIGFVSGVAGKRTWFRRRGILYLAGFFAGILFDWFLNLQYLIGYIRPVTWQAVMLTYVAGLGFDLVHGGSTVLFLMLLEKPWGKKLHRLKVKYGILSGQEERGKEKSCI